MRWAYKTVLYSLKKDGFLGDSFLDEEEMERSLNEYGKAGWELVSFVEVTEGFRAIFKYLLEEGREEVPARQAASTTPDIALDDLAPPVPILEKSATGQPLADIRIKEEKENTLDKGEYPAVDVGSIRIE